MRFNASSLKLDFGAEGLKPELGAEDLLRHWGDD
jgi:hypothetical protein